MCVKLVTISFRYATLENAKLNQAYTAFLLYINNDYMLLNNIYIIDYMLLIYLAIIYLKIYLHVKLIN